MAEQIEQKIVYSADFTNLANALQEVMEKITNLRTQMKGLKSDSEEYGLLTQELAQAEEQLANVIAAGGGKIDSAKVSYKDLNEELKALRKQYKETSDVAQRAKLTPTIGALDTELKSMDRAMGVYNRNVGNYAVEMEKAMNNVKMQTVQVLREVPSLANGIQTFFIAIANNIPMLVDAIERYKELANTAKSTAGAVNKSTVAHSAEAKAAMAAALAKETESAANAGGTSAHLAEADATESALQTKKKELEVTIADTRAKVANAEATLASAKAEMMEARSVQFNDSSQEERIKARTRYFLANIKATKAEDELADAQKELTMQEGQLKTTQDLLSKSTKDLGTAQDAAAKSSTAFGSSLKLIAKSILNWQTLIIVAVTLLAMYGKEVGQFIEKLFQGKDAFNGWVDGLKKGNEASAEAIIQLQVYNKWATDTSKSDEERNKAAKEVLKTLGETVNQTNIAKAMNGEYAGSIKEVTDRLIQQAKAQALLETITEQYKNTVVKQQNKLIKAEERGGPNVWQRIGANFAQGQGIDVTADDLYADQIERRKKKIEEANADFERYVERFTKDFNPSDLLDKIDENSNNGADKWFSKWELYIKTIEAGLAKIQGEYETLDVSAIWKYSSEGYDAYIKMYDEIAEHNKGDEKQYKDALNNKLKYETEYLEYHKKLQLQYRDSNKTSYDIDNKKLEEWYHSQLAIYKNAGEDTLNLTAEYNKRKAELDRKYRDEYANAQLQGIDYELAELKTKFDDIIYEYEQKGIDTNNVVLEYEQQKNKIISKYESDATKIMVGEIERQKKDAIDAFQTLKNIWAQGIDYQYNNTKSPYENITDAVNQGNDATEMAYSRVGGTSVTGHKQRQGEITATQSQKTIFEEGMQAEIAAMQSVLESEKLMGEEKLEMQLALADAERELALGSAEYQMELNQLVLEDTKETVAERMNEMKNIANGLSDIFDDVYTAIENNLNAQVTSGEIAEEEAEKQLEKYRGIKAAAAAMDAMAAAVSSYNSLASIPYVGPVLGAIAAAAALTAGFAQVKAIMAVSKDSPTATQVDSFTPGLSDFNPQYSATMTGASEQTDLKNAIAQGMASANIIVQVKDIEDAQTKARVRDEESSF